MWKHAIAVSLVAVVGCDPRTYQQPEPGAGQATPVTAPTPAVPDTAAAGSAGTPAPTTTASAGKVVANKHVVMELRGEINEVPGPWDIGGGPGKTLRDVIGRIDRIANDASVKSLLVRISPLSVGMAAAEELHAALTRMSRRGKTVACHLETGGNTEYLVATACGQIALAPAGDLMLVGPAAEAMFVKGLLDKLGIVADFEHQGRYKGAADSLQRETLSAEQRETIDALLDGASERITTAIAAARKIPLADARKLFDQAPFSAASAKRAKLVDRLESFEDFRAGVTKGAAWESALANEPKRAMPNLFDLFSGAKPEGPKGKRVAVVYMVGPIVHGRGGGGFLPSQEVASRTLVGELERLAADDDVRAVVLRIDSPGGSALASDIIWEAVREVAAKKPVIASMGNVAASGGYYIAAGAQKIFAQPDTITGSIGVIGGKLVLGGLYQKLGVTKEIITRGSRAAIFTEARKFTDDERAVVNAMMKDTYAQFIDRVATGRRLPKSTVEPLAQGRVWSGADAHKRKLVDELGGLDDALADARKRAKLGADAPVEIWPPAPTLTDFFDRFGGGSDVRIAIFTQLLAELGQQPLAGLNLLSAFTRFEHDHIQAVMPFTLRIR